MVAEVEEVAGAKEGVGPETAGGEEVVIEAGKKEEVCEFWTEREEPEAASRQAPCFKMSPFLGRERYSLRAGILSKLLEVVGNVEVVGLNGDWSCWGGWKFGVGSSWLSSWLSSWGFEVGSERAESSNMGLSLQSVSESTGAVN
jgi:hypothetical protein